LKSACDQLSTFFSLFDTLILFIIKMSRRGLLNLNNSGKQWTLNRVSFDFDCFYSTGLFSPSLHPVNSKWQILQIVIRWRKFEASMNDCWVKDIKVDLYLLCIFIGTCCLYLLEFDLFRESIFLAKLSTVGKFPTIFVTTYCPEISQKLTFC
jgi:hypothetical protein